MSTKEFDNIKRLIREGFDLESMSTTDSGFQGSDAEQTEYGFAMKRFMLDTASVNYEPPPSMHPADDDTSSRASSDTSVPHMETPGLPNEDEPTLLPLDDRASLSRRKRHLEQTPSWRRTILRKTIVSRAALLQMGYWFEDDPDDDQKVRFARRLTASEVAALRGKSLRLGMD